MADLVRELRRSGESVPSDVMKDLHSAKTMIEILKVDPSRSEHILRIEEYLNNVESHLMPSAKRKLGEDRVDQWMKRILEARKSVQGRKREPTRMPPIGIPRDKLWVRMEPTREMSTKKIERIAEEEGLDFRTGKDGRVLVYGEEESVKQFVRKIAQIIRERGESIPKPGAKHVGKRAPGAS
jgi:hypothetical protein